MQQRLAQPQAAPTRPVVLERQQALWPSDVSEGVHIAVPGPQPAVEFDPELKRAFGFAQEFGFVEAECSVEQMNLRDRCFANSDRGDLVALDQ